MGKLSTPDIIVIFAYLIGMVIIGLLIGRKIKTDKDYLSAMGVAEKSL